MPTITIARRFRGPPNSGNGGYVCGALAQHVDGPAEVTLRSPPPLERALEVVPGANGIVELREGERVVAAARPTRVNVGDIPRASRAEADEAMSRTPWDVSNHLLPECFVCGPGRAHGDGLRLFAGPLPPTARKEGGSAMAAGWTPAGDLAAADGLVAPEFVWAALDCPTGYAGAGAGEFGIEGTPSILLGRMSAEIRDRPRPGDACVVVAWPTLRDGRKLLASAALLGPGGATLAVAQATWLIVDRQVQLGQS